MMSESVGSADFDVEAQESLLSAGEGVSEEERISSSSSSSSVDAKQKLWTCILCIRSSLVFTSGAHHHYDSSSSSSIRIHISGDDDDEGSGTAPAAFADTPDHAVDLLHDISSAHDSPAQTQLQQLQRGNVSEIVKTKNLEDLRGFGGVTGVAEALNTDLQNGITIPDQQTSPRNPTQLYQFLNTICHSFLESCNNTTVLILFVAAALTLGFGIQEEGQRMGWFNGGVLMATWLFIVSGTTIRTCWEKWARIKSKGGRMSKVKTVRGGVPHTVDEVDLVVGDIAIVHKGDQLPADGLFVAGGSLQLDDGTTIDEHNNPFMFYGSRVMNGEGRMLVTSTGMDTVWGEMMIRATNKEFDCKLECYLNRLFLSLHISGLLISLLIIVVLFLRYKAGKLDDERRYRPDSKGEPAQLKTFFDALEAIMTGSKGTARVVFTLLSVSLLGIVETVPWVISASIMIWSRRILGNKGSERDSFACVNMGRVTTICTDISGALIEHEYGSHKLYVGEGFVRDISIVDTQVVEALRDVIAAPSLLSAMETDGDPEVDSFLSWAESVLGMDRNLIEQSKEIRDYTYDQHLQLIMEKNGNRGFLHCKGPPHQILSMCSHHYNIDGEIQEIDVEKERKLRKDISHVLAEDAQASAYACKRIQDLTQHPPNDLAFLAMMSKTKMEAINLSVSKLKEERIRIILASGEDVSVLNLIAQKYGLLSTDDLVLTTGEQFRSLGIAERKNTVEKICIIGNCSPEDKLLLVECLKESGQVVVLVAHATVDAPALKLADIGLTYSGDSSSEIATDCCDITLSDANSCCFGFLLKAIKSGRCLLENLRKFIQMQLIFAASSSLINFIATVALGDGPITPVQLFWLNLVVPLVGGLALLTGSTSASPPTESPEKLMTREMWRNICVQVCYQTGVFVAVQHKGQDLLKTSGDRVKLTIYNAFFLCQLFSIFIARQPREMNIFRGLLRSSRCIWVAVFLFIASQAVFAAAEIFIGGSPGLSLKLWGECLLIASISWPLDFAAKIVFFFLF